MQIIVTPFLKYAAMAIYPFVLIKHESLKQDEVLIRHETIHLRQQIELLIIPFYFIYLINYLVNLLRYRNHDEAYHHIVFEQEAYLHESEIEYLQKRTPYAWMSFLKKH